MRNTLRRIKQSVSLDKPELQFIKRIILKRQIVNLKWKLQGKPSPPPHSVKQTVIKTFIKAFNYNYFIETGTYLGAMISTVLGDFKKIYTIELSPELHKRADRLFKNYKHVHCLQGDSSVVLKQLVPQLDQGSIFWLDGHYSGGITALGDKVCPIYEELESIIAHDLHNHVILIDDSRLFLSGEQDYPLFQDLSKYIKNLNSDYNIYVFITDTIVVTKVNLNDYPSFNNYIQAV
jgi:hypothetical protein